MIPSRRFSALLDQPIPPGHPIDTMGLKKGGKPKRKKQTKKASISQIQKVNIKIGDLYKKKEDDTAMIMKDRQSQRYPIMPSSFSTNLRLESPVFKYAQPLPSVIPNLYQANPSSISVPLISGQPSSSKGGDLQPKLNNPIVLDTDPNDLQKNQIRDPVIRAIPSEPSVSGSISGIVGDVGRSLSSKEAGYNPEIDYENDYLPSFGYLSTNVPSEEPKQVLRWKRFDELERSASTRGPKPQQKEIYANVYESDVYPIYEEVKPFRTSGIDQNILDVSSRENVGRPSDESKMSKMSKMSVFD